MYICKCMHIWLCMFTYTHIYLHMYIHAYTCIRKTMQRFWLIFLGENETLRRLMFNGVPYEHFISLRGVTSFPQTEFVDVSEEYAQ